MTRIHLVCLPHTNLNKEYVACAYTQRNYKFVGMMQDIGYDVITYAGEHTDCDPYENVVIASDEDQMRWFGEHDFHSEFFNITWGVDDIHWVETCNRSVAEISKRLKPGDIVCISAGLCHKRIHDALSGKVPVIEYGIGYSGVFSEFKVFESYSHMHWIYGRLGTDNGQHYDAVIPNYFNPSDFRLAEKEDYHVFLGRFIPRKGIEVAVEATRRLGVELIMAGQGAKPIPGGWRTNEGQEYVGDHLRHIGHVNEQQRAELLSKAKVCYMPTFYVEPFGGVSVESLMSGTPVVGSDFGAFTEIVHNGYNGYRFRTIGEAAKAAENIENGFLKWRPEDIRNDAISRYSTKRVALMYDDYFQQVLGIRDGRDWISGWHGRPTRYNYPHK